MQEFKALGNPDARAPDLEVFPAPAGVTRVQMTTDEVTAVCPITAQPDWYTVDIDYAPGAFCIESKSLKLYLQSFRNEGAFCEELAATILGEVCRVARPRDCTVTLIQKPRGGITIRAVATMGEGAPGSRAG